MPLTAICPLLDPYPSAALDFDQACRRGCSSLRFDRDAVCLCAPRAHAMTRSRSNEHASSGLPAHARIHESTRARICFAYARMHLRRLTRSFDIRPWTMSNAKCRRTRTRALARALARTLARALARGLTCAAAAARARRRTRTRPAHAHTTRARARVRARARPHARTPRVHTHTHLRAIAPTPMHALAVK
eukprot:3744063-Pleurochrysis_carterae.AAC.2